MTYNVNTRSCRPLRLSQFRTLVATAALLAALAAPAAMRAQVITTADGNGADTTLGGETNTGTVNFGADPILRAQDFTAGSSTVALVRFDLSGVSGVITSANLDMTICCAALRVGDLFEVHGLKDSENADNWGELTITYQNAPGLAFVGLGSDDVDPAKTDFLGTATRANPTSSFSNAALA